MGSLLKDVVVIETAQVITGPMAGLQLAELGATVIKVEPPGRGDSFRRWDGRDTARQVPASFAAYNRGKHSITLDTRVEEGKEVYRRLARSADVIIENFRPGVMDEAGIGPAQLRAADPRLIYCSITGFGSTGPRAGRPSYDAVAQALSGLWSQFTDLGNPEPVGPPMADQLTGMYASSGILAALAHRERTGEGATLEVSMLASCLAFQTLALTSMLAGEAAPDRSARARRSLTFAFRDAGGLPFCIHLSSPQKFWVALCEALGEPALATDPRFQRKADRTARYTELQRLLQARFATAPRAVWLERMEAHGVPAGPILGLDEAIADPQALALTMIPPPGADGAIAGALCHDGVRCGAASAAPVLGADTDEVLRSIGLDGDRIAGLRAHGVV